MTTNTSEVDSSGNNVTCCPTSGGTIDDKRNDTTLLDVIHTLLERKGKFQCILIVLLCLNSIIIGINHTVTTFHVYVPHFFCRDDPERACGVIVNGTECPSGYSFNEADDISLAVEWSTVCGRALLAPLVNSLYFVGVTLGALSSSLCDVWGRKNLVLVFLYAQAVMGLAQYFSTSLQAFSVFRLAQGFFIQGLQTCSYTLMLEYCPSKLRTIAATYWESNWAIGLGILGAVAYYIREWRLLTLIMTLPAVISLGYSWIFPESIIWLYAKGQHKEALRLVKKIAKFNGFQDIVLHCNSMNLASTDLAKRSNCVEETGTDGTVAVTVAAEKTNLLAIIRSPVLRKHLLSMIFVWFSVTLSYYGILYFLPNLAGQRHLNFLFGALIELIAYFLAYFVLSSFGRRIPMAFYQYANGILILLIAFITMLPDGSYSKVWLVAVTLVAKGLAVSSFCGMFIYCSELLPTVCRGIGLGVCGFSARCGSLLAPQLMALILVYPAYVSLSFMSMLLLIAATVTLFLPETLSSCLPNTIAEADEMWGKRK